MAKVTGQLPPKDWAVPNYPGMRAIDQLGGTSARMWPGPPQEWIDGADPQREKMGAALAAWRALQPWKKARWALCALVGGSGSARNDAWDDGGSMWDRGVSIWGLVTWAGRKGWNGWTLYLQCWLSQGVITGNQPISPCARRITDPDAHFFDFTP